MPTAILRGSLTTMLTLALLAFTIPGCGDDDELPPPSRDASPDEPPPAEAPDDDDDDAGAGPPYAIDVDCPIGTIVEREPNNTADTATPLDGQLSICGSISPGTDVDYSTFTTPPGKKLTMFQAVIDGKVDFELAVGGKTLRPSDVKEFETGTYVVKAFSSDGQPGKYRYRIQFEP